MNKSPLFIGLLLILWAGTAGYSVAQEMTPMGEEGYTNTLYGYGAGSSLTGGISDTFLGSAAGFSTTDGIGNTFVGYGSGQYNSIGDFNVFLGAFTGTQNTDANYNTFVGGNAGRVNKGGELNTFVGNEAGRMNSNGQYNTYVGADSGHWNVGGSYNVCIGYKAGFDEEGSYRLYINGAPRGDPLIYGEFDNRIVVINGELESDTSRISSDLRLKKEIRPLESSLEKVLKLKGVSYEWRAEDYPDRGFSKRKQIGLVAQDVEEIIPELVNTNGSGFKSISYDRLTAVLVEAVKELKLENEQLKALLLKKVKKQQSRIDELIKLMGEKKS